MNLLPCIAAACAVCTVLPAQLQKTVVASGLNSPVFVTAPPGDDRVFIVEKRGRILILKDGQVLPTPFLNIGPDVADFGEAGLLAVAFHPLYSANGFFYVSYVQNDPLALLVKRYSVSAANPDLADATSGRVMLGPLLKPEANHNGGCIQFGADGYLYISTGDGGLQGDPNCEAQDRRSLLGKLLRLDVNGQLPRIPPDNPFVAFANTADEIWAIGFRNPWRFSFDRVTGDLFVADVGYASREEISFQPSDSPGGENYGWNTMQGAMCFQSGVCVPGQLCHDSRLTPPILDYENGINCAIIGGYVYRGSEIPGVQGTYFYGDFCSGRIWSFRYSNGEISEMVDRTDEIGAISLLSSFGEDGHGELYIVSLDGIIYKLGGTGNTNALFSTFGSGCPGSAGTPTLSAVPGYLPWIGHTFKMRLGSMPGSVANIPFALLGTSNTGWAGNPLPRKLNFMGLIECRQYVSVDIAGPLVNVGGTASWDIAIPADPALIGVRFYTQALVLDPGVNPAGAIVTNAGEAIIGLRPRVTAPGGATSRSVPVVK